MGRGLGVGRVRTDIELFKVPLTSHEFAISLPLFLLAYAKVNTSIIARIHVVWNDKALAVAVTLIDTIYVDEHSQTRGNVARRNKMDGEVFRRGWDGNEGLHNTISVGCAILSKLFIRPPQLNGTVEVLERWHVFESCRITDCL